MDMVMKCIQSIRKSKALTTTNSVHFWFLREGGDGVCKWCDSITHAWNHIFLTWYATSYYIQQIYILIRLVILQGGKRDKWKYLSNKSKIDYSTQLIAGSVKMKIHSRFSLYQCQYTDFECLILVKEEITDNQQLRHLMEFHPIWNQQQHRVTSKSGNIFIIHVDVDYENI